MSKYVVFEVGNGGFLRGGFPVKVRLGEDGQAPYPLTEGQLPPLPQLTDNYQQWQSNYRSRGLPTRLEVIEEEPTQVSDFESARVLTDSLNGWLNSEQFRKVKEDLFAELNRNEQIRFVVETKEPIMWQLPWHLWDFFDKYPKAEVAFSPANPGNSIEQAATPGGKVRILAIEGDRSGIDIRQDRQEIENLADAQALFLENPKPEDICKSLWEESWDILFFAGHSSSNGDRSTGEVKLDPSNSLAIPDIRHALTEAIGKGLKLAIFNSCDGLGLARNLAELHIPQVIFMREPVPDGFAQKFWKDFLQAFSGGKSLYASVQEARKKLELWEKRCPGATWLPVICQNNPEIAPPSWTQLRGSSPQLDKQELDKHEIDKQELDKQQIDKQELDKQELDKQELDKQQKPAGPLPGTKPGGQLLPVQKMLLGMLGAASLVYVWGLSELLSYTTGQGNEKSDSSASLVQPGPELGDYFNAQLESGNKKSRTFSSNSSSASTPILEDIFVPPEPSDNPVASLANILDLPEPENYLPPEWESHLFLQPNLSSYSGSPGLDFGGASLLEDWPGLTVTGSNPSKALLSLSGGDRAWNSSSRSTTGTESLARLLLSGNSGDIKSFLSSEYPNFVKPANRQPAKPVNNIAAPVRGVDELANTKLASDSSDQTEQVPNSFEQSQNIALASVLAFIAGHYAEAGQPEQAAEFLARAQEFAEKIDESSDRATALATIAGKYAEAGQPEKAAALLKQAQDIAQNIDDPLEQATVLAAIAREQAQMGDRQQATETVEQALPLARRARESANPSERVSALTEIARAALRAGDRERAAEIIEETLPLVRQIATPRERGYALAEVASAASEAGDGQQVTEIVGQALPFVAEMVNPLERVSALTLLAKAASRAGDRQLAVDIIERARAIAGEIVNPAERAEALAETAITASEGGDGQQVTEIIGQALPLVREMANPPERVGALNLLAKAASRAGDRQLAVDIVEQTLPLALTIANPSQRAEALADTAIAASEAGNQDQTSEIIGQALPLVREMTNPSEKASALTLFATAASTVGNEQQAADLLKETLPMAANITDPAEKVTAIAGVVVAARETNNPEKTKSFLNQVAPIALQYKPSPPLPSEQTASASNGNFLTSWWQWFGSKFGIEDRDEEISSTDEAAESEGYGWSWAHDDFVEAIIGAASIDSVAQADIGLSVSCYRERERDIFGYFKEAANNYEYTQDYTSVFESIYQSQEFITWWKGYPNAGQQSDCSLPAPVSKDKDMLDCLQGDSCVDIAKKSAIASQDNVRVPEPSSTAGVLVLGTLGAIATLKRKPNQGK